MTAALFNVVAFVIALMIAFPSMALDGRKPWMEPHDAEWAAKHSDEYAWRLFVALNWPADPVARAADPRGKFGAARPVVWETWQNAEDVYLDDGADPGPWTLGGPGRALDPAHRFETISLRDLPNARHIVNGAMVPVTDPVETAARLTEIRMNRAAFDYIRARELYTVEGQLRAVAQGTPISFPSDAIEIKAKWRPIDDGDRLRYHTVSVMHQNGITRLYGLTALHIVSKDLPHWFWATFEHVDNPSLADGEGWLLPSRDEFACPGDGDCHAMPRKIGLEGTVWQYYRLRGTMTDYVDSDGRALLLANSELETGLQGSASCITCHSRASIGVMDGAAVRLPIFNSPVPTPRQDMLLRRGFTGLPPAQWFQMPGSDQTRRPVFQQLDFVWSLSKAKARGSPAAVAGVNLGLAGSAPE